MSKKKYRFEEDAPKLLLIVVGLAYLLLYQVFKDFKTAGIALTALCFLIVAIGVPIVLLIWKLAKKRNPETNAEPTPLPIPKVARSVESVSRYVERPFLTGTELLFFRDLHRAVMHPLLVQCKVGLWAVAKETDATGWNQIAQKHLDFVIYHPGSNKVLLAIELDDYTHESRKTRERDAVKNAILQQAGIPLVRVQVGKEYDFDRILSSVQPAQKKSRSTS